MTYPRQITARLLDTDATTVITGALDNAFDVSFMDEFSGYGWGEISLQLDDAGAVECRRGRFVQILSDVQPVFSFKIEGAPKYQQIDEGEESHQFLSISGRGWGCVFEEAIVYPEVAELTMLDYSYRLFSFASFYFANLDTWGLSQVMYEYFDGLTAGTGRVEGVVDPGPDPDTDSDDELKLYPSPIGFPWPNAYHNGDGSAPTPTYSPTYWIIGNGASEDSVGYHFFRGYFTLAGEQEVKFLATADNLFTLFLSGVPILGETDDTLMWLGWKEVTLVLPAGFYVVAAAVQNVDADITYNPGGFLFNAIATAVYPGEIETSLTLNLLSSDGGWDSTFSATEWPGWTVGQILEQLRFEAVTRGAILQFNAYTFTDTQDSEGEDWNTKDPDTTTMFIPTFSCRIGQTMGQVLSQLVDEGWLEWHFKPDTLSLDGFSPGTAGDITGVIFAPAVNIVGLERGETKPYANSLLVQWAKGFVTVDNPTEIAAYGSRVEDIYSTDAATQVEAERQGRIELYRRIVSAQAAVLMAIEPTSSFDCPYEGFKTGDYVSIPQIDGTGTDLVQVLSITMQADELGYARWSTEVNERWRAPEREHVDLLRSIGGKSYGTPTDRGVAKD